MDFDAIFQSYYTQYRGESQTPSSTDSEYTIAMRYANDAVKRWSNYDGTYWKELFVKSQDAADGDKTLTTGTTTYSAPTNFREAGGFIKIRKASDSSLVRTIPIIEPHEAQFKSDNAHFAYFTGNVSDGFTLNLNQAPTSDENGHLIDYIYYKKPSEFATGTDTTEMAIPEFIIYHALAHRFKASRNWSAYQISKRDAEDALKTMQLDNNSGNWANPWKVTDNSGSTWGL